MGSNGELVEPAPSKAGLWEDFVDIFYVPSSVFARRANGQFGLALLFLVLACVLLVFLTKGAMQPIMDAEFARQGAAAMRTSPRINSRPAAISSKLSLRFSSASGWPSAFSSRDWCCGW